MPDRDSHPVVVAHRAAPTRRGANGDDTPQAAEGRDDAFPNESESKYPATAAGRPDTEPLKVRIELVVVDGHAADALRKNQARAVAQALQWFADHPTGNEGQH